jgi:hypothetical protein
MKESVTEIMHLAWKARRASEIPVSKLTEQEINDSYEQIIIYLQFK